MNLFNNSHTWDWQVWVHDLLYCFTNLVAVKDIPSISKYAFLLYLFLGVRVSGIRLTVCHFHHLQQARTWGGGRSSRTTPPNSTNVHFFRLLILYLFQNFQGQAPNSPGMSSLVHISSQMTPQKKNLGWVRACATNPPHVRFSVAGENDAVRHTKVCQMKISRHFYKFGFKPLRTWWRAWYISY